MAPDALVTCPECGKNLKAKVFQQLVEMELTPEKQKRAVAVATRRNLESAKVGDRNRYGLVGGPKKDLEMHIAGTSGELPTAEYKGIPWAESVNTYGEPDVGDIQVRTRTLLGYELYVRPQTKTPCAIHSPIFEDGCGYCKTEGDDPKYPYMLVVLDLPKVYIMGWRYGWEAARKQWLRPHGGRRDAYFVPHEELKPPSTCPLWLPTGVEPQHDIHAEIKG